MLISTNTFSQVLPLTNAGNISVGNHLHYWCDDTGKIGIGNIDHIKFKLLDQAEPNFGFDRRAFWFKIDVKNQSEHHDWMLELAYAPIDTIDFFIQSESSGAWIHKTSGDMLPTHIRDIPHRLPLFTFNIAAGESKSIYLRIKTTSSVQVPITMWHRNAFVWTYFKIQMLNGLFYGAMLIMILYQLVLFFSVRERITLYYILTLFSMMNIVAFFQGYTYLYIHPETPLLNHFFAVFSGPLFVLFSTLLTREFLELRRLNKVLDNLMLTNMMLNILAGLLMVTFSHRISYKYHHYFIFLHSVLVLISAAYCLHKKYRPAFFYLMAWITPLIASSFFTLSNLGFIPGYLSTNFTGVMAGCILQMLFIAFALGERWNQLRKENQQAKELAIRLGKEENIRLEREVKLRTIEIQHQKDRLEDANRVKDKLFSVISHDIKGPLNSLKLALALTRTNKISHEDFKEISAGLENHLGKTNEFIQNLLDWAKLQLRGEAFEPISLNLMTIVDETIALLKPEMTEKNIFVRKDVPDGPLMAYADPNMIRTVFRNLLTNAIKFTPTGGIVVVNGKSSNHNLIISVADTGVGIPESYRDRIFTLESITTLGTQQESGTGLGLVLCKEYVEKNNGHIWFESKEGAGTTFYFSLPEVQEKRFA